MSLSSLVEINSDNHPVAVARSSSADMCSGCKEVKVGEVNHIIYTSSNSNTVVINSNRFFTLQSQLD
jgi:hypothetical protein